MLGPEIGVPPTGKRSPEELVLRSEASVRPSHLAGMVPDSASQEPGPLLRPTDKTPAIEGGNNGPRTTGQRLRYRHSRRWAEPETPGAWRVGPAARLRPRGRARLSLGH